MGALTNASQQRAESRETDDLTILLGHAADEIRVLMGEMHEILGHYATHYSLFPRVAGAMRVVFEAEDDVLAQAAARAPELAPLVRDLRRSHRELLRQADELGKVHGKDAQTRDPEWRRGFERLRAETLATLTREEGELHPALRRAFGPRVTALGRAYKHALWQQADTKKPER